MKWENTPCCDDCWWDVDERNFPTVNGRGVFEESGQIDMRMPYRFANAHRAIETCHFCGFTTFSGIYVRTDVDETPSATPRERS